VIGVGSPAGARRGAIAGRSLALFPADAESPLIEPLSGRWHAQNVAKRPGTGATGGTRPGKRSGRLALGDGPGNRRPPTSDAAGQSVDVDVDGHAKWWAAAGSPVYLSKRIRRSRWGDAIADWPPDSGYGRPQACCWTRLDDRPTSQCSF